MTNEVMKGTPENIRTMWGAGYRLIPLRHKSPAHLGKKWQERVPTSYLETVELFQRHPGDVGIFTPGSLIVADVDVKNDASGDSVWHLLTEELGEDHGREIITSSGGWHIFWRRPDGFSRGNGMLGKDIDVRADSNGFVQAYGSPEDYPPTTDLSEPPAAWRAKLEHTESVKVTPGEVEYSKWEPSADLTQFVEEVPEGGRSEAFFEAVRRAYAEGALNGDAWWLEGTPVAEKYESEGRLEDQFAVCWEKARRHSQEMVKLESGGIGLRDPKDLDPLEEDKAEPAIFTFSRGDELDDWPHVEWMIDELVPKGGIGQIIGPPGSRKSFCAIDIGLSIASGHSDWYGLEINYSGSILYIPLEGQLGVAQRYKAWKKGRNNGHGVPEFVTLKDGQFLLLEDTFERFIEAVPFDPIMVILDTQGQALAGKDENSYQDMSMAMRRLAAMGSHFNATVLAVHHTGKDVTKGGRGHSAQLGALDFQLEVSKDEETHVVTLKSRKQKDGSDEQELYFDRNVVEVGTNPQGKVITSIFHTLTDKPEAREESPKKRRNDIDSILLRQANAHPEWSQKQLVDHVSESTGFAINTLKNHYRKLRDMGEFGA